MSICAFSRQDFESLLRITKASIANPPWFALPVDAEEDEHCLSVSFDVRDVGRGEVRLQLTEESLTLWGPAGEMRICGLPCAIIPTSMQKSRAGDWIRIRMRKKRPAIDSAEPGPTCDRVVRRNDASRSARKPQEAMVALQTSKWQNAHQ